MSRYLPPGEEPFRHCPNTETAVSVSSLPLALGFRLAYAVDALRRGMQTSGLWDWGRPNGCWYCAGVCTKQQINAALSVRYSRTASHHDAALDRPYHLAPDKGLEIALAFGPLVQPNGIQD